MENTVLKLNVGGTKYATFLSTVQGSLLERLYKSDVPQATIDDHIFIDRDGKLFRHVLNYARTGEVTCDEKDISLLIKELEYFIIEHDIKDLNYDLFDTGENCLRSAYNKTYGRVPFLIRKGGDILLFDSSLEQLRIIVWAEKVEEFICFLRKHSSMEIYSRAMFEGTAWFVELKGCPRKF